MMLCLAFCFYSQGTIIFWADTENCSDCVDAQGDLAPRLEKFFPCSIQLSTKISLLKLKYENASNSWHFQIISRESFVLSHV